MARKRGPSVHLNPEKESEAQIDVCISRLLIGRCQPFRDRKLVGEAESRMEHMVMAHFLGRRE